jgi:hypothetical protein
MSVLKNSCYFIVFVTDAAIKGEQHTWIIIQNQNKHTPRTSLYIIITTFFFNSAALHPHRFLPLNTSFDLLDHVPCVTNRWV